MDVPPHPLGPIGTTLWRGVNLWEGARCRLHEQYLCSVFVLGGITQVIFKTKVLYHFLPCKSRVVHSATDERNHRLLVARPSEKLEMRIHTTHSHLGQKSTQNPSMAK